MLWMTQIHGFSHGKGQVVGIPKPQEHVLLKMVIMMRCTPQENSQAAARSLAVVHLHFLAVDFLRWCTYIKTILSY